MCAAHERSKRNLSLPPYRRTVAQLRGSLWVWAVGPLTQRFGQLPLFHGSANTLLSGGVASIQPGEWKEKKRQKKRKQQKGKQNKKEKRKYTAMLKILTVICQCMTGWKSHVECVSYNINSLIGERQLSQCHLMAHTTNGDVLWTFYEQNYSCKKRWGAFYMYKRKKCVSVQFFWCGF